jgi:hypothetical protein
MDNEKEMKEEIDPKSFNAATGDVKVLWARIAKTTYDSLNIPALEAKYEPDERVRWEKAARSACAELGLSMTEYLKDDTFVGDYGTIFKIENRIETYSTSLLWSEVEDVIVEVEGSQREDKDDPIEMNNLTRDRAGILEILIPTLEALGLLAKYKMLISERELLATKPQKVGEIVHAMDTKEKLDLAIALIHSKGYPEAITKENIKRWIKAEDSHKVIYVDDEGKEMEVRKRGYT